LRGALRERELSMSTRRKSKCWAVGYRLAMKEVEDISCVERQAINTCSVALDCERSLVSVPNVINEISLPLFV
jgi:hypothetical protein